MLERKVGCLQSCTPLSSKLLTGSSSFERAVFVSLAFAAFFVAVASTQEAFADSVPVLQHTAPGQVHYRDVSESLAVASLFDSPSQPRTFTRSLNDGLSVSTGFNTPAQQAQTYGPVQQRTNSSPTPVAMQRSDERLTFRSIGKLATTSTAGTPYNSAVSPFSGQQQAQTDEQTDQALQEILNVSGDGADPDSNSSFLSQLAAYNAYIAMETSVQNAILINAGASAVLLAGALVAVVARQPAISEGRAQKRLLALFMLKHQLDAAPKAGGAPATYSLLVVFAVFTVSSMAVAVGPSSAQEYVETLGGARIELSSAYHLDSSRAALSDIYEQSKKLDGVWTNEITDGQYVRATFEQDLTSARDITVFARAVSGTPRIEVYEAGADELVAEFASLNSDRYSKVLLTNLQGSQDTFDLRVVGGSVEFDYITDPSPVPTYVGAGASAANGGTITPTLPSSIQENDILLLFVETANQAASISNSNGGTWTEVADSPQGTGSAGGTASTALTVFWSRYNGVQGNPTVADSGNHQVGVILAFRGVATTGDPWDVTSGGVEATSDTSGSIPGDTTTEANTLVVAAIAISLDASSTTNFSGWSNANLSSVTERFDFASNVQNGGGLGIATGEKATAGTYGATSVTLAASAAKGMMTIALRPPPPGPPTLSISEPDGTNDRISRDETYSITYTLSDPDDDVTVAFYYDTDNSGFDGTAISGACATAPEGTNVTCDWDTTGLVVGDYYVYGISNDGLNPAVSAYSPGAITIDRVPTFVGAGSGAGASGAITLALPAGIQENDILLLFVETADQAVSLSDQNGGTWTEVANSPQGASAGTLATSARITIFWSRYNGVQGDPTVANSGNHNLGVILAFRGVIDTGDPWDVTSGNSESPADTSLAATGATTTAANTFIVIAAALMDDDQNFGATWTNSDLSNITVRANESTTAGNDGRLAVVTGKKTSVGTYGDTTNTLTASSVKGMMTIALKPLPSTRETSDSLSVSDGVAAKLTGKAVSQSLSVADGIVAKITGKAIGESLSVSDSVDAQKIVIPDTNVAAMAYRSDTGVDGTSSPKYREWNPTIKEWGAEVELESAGSPIRNAWLEWSSVSTKRVIVVLSADGTLDSYVCDNDCTTPENWTVTHDFADLWSVEPAATWRPFDMEYEKTSGDLVIVYDRVSPGSNTADLFYRIMPDSSHTFGDESSFNDVGSIIPENVYSFVRLDSRRTTDSNDLGLVALSSTNSRAAAWYWNGSTDTFGDYKELTTSVSSTNYEAIGVAFETFTGDLIAVAGQGNDVMYSEFSSGSWSSMAKVMTPSGDDIDVGTVRWIRLVGNDNPGTTVAFLAVSGYDGFVHMLDSADWSGTGWEVYGLGTRHDAAIDTSETRVFDYAWDNSDAAFRGILVWATSSGLISFKKHSTPSAWTSTITVSDDGTTHPWIALNEKSNPTASDAVSVLGAVMDDGADISPIVWYGLTSNIASLGDDGITTVGSSSSESFRTDFRRSSMVKKFPSTVLTVTDSVVARLSAKVFTDSVAVVESAIGEKGSPASSSAAAAVYRSNTGTHTLNSPKYREWDPATQTWSAEVELPNTGSPVRDAKVRFSPDSSMRIVVSQSADGTLNLYKCDSGCTTASNWALVAADFTDTGLVDANKYYRAYDVLFSTQSETAMIVYDKEDTDDNDFWYRTYDGTTLSEEFGFNLGGSADAEEIRYLRLAANPSSEEMALVLINSNALSSYALVWDGSSWGNQQLMSNVLNADNRDGESIGIAYEKSGAALAISANGQNSIKYSRWNGSSWTTPTHTDPNPPDTGEFVKFVTVKPDPAPGSTKVMVCQSDQLSDLSCSLFDAGTPGTWNMITTNVGTTSGRAFDFVYHPSGTTGVLVSSSGASGTLDYRTFDGTSFAGHYAVSAAGTHKWVYGATAPAADDVVNALFVKSNSNFDSGALKFKAQIVSAIGDASLTSDSFNDTYESIHIDFQLSKLRKRAISDSMAVTDAIALTPGKSLSDSVGVSDSITAKITARAINDALAVTDTISAKVTKRVISDELAVTDTIAAKVTARALADELSVQDAIVAKITGVGISETLAITDDVVAKITGISITDSIGLTDTLTGKVTRRVIADSVTIEDEIAITKVFDRPVDDSLAITDAVTKSVTKLVSDEIEATDAIPTTVSRSIDDSLELTDDIARPVTKLVSDEVELSDAISTTVTKPLSDELALTDDIALRVARSLSDSLEVGSAVAVSIQRSASDALEITDDVAVTVGREVSNEVNIDDSISTRVTRSIEEELEVTDSPGRTIGILIDDAVTVTDSIAKATTREISDAIAVTDAISTRVSRHLDDELVIEDNSARSVTLQIADSVSIEDLPAISQNRQAQETLEIGDEIAKSVTKQVADELLITDAISTNVTKSISDTLDVASQAVPSIGRTIDESLDVEDSISKNLSKSTEDSLDIADSISIRISRSVSDDVEVSDEIDEPTIFLDDEVGITDAVSKVVVKAVTDSVQITDEVTAKITGIAISDEIEVFDEIQRPGVPLSETVSVTDGVVASVEYLREIDDEITVDDAIFRPPTPVESVAVTDSISIGVFRVIEESIELDDKARRGWFVSISDSLQVVASLTDVSWARTLALEEPFSLATEICLPGLCETNHPITHNLGLHDEVELVIIPPPELEDAVIVSDHITLGLKVSAVPPIVQSLAVTDSVTAQIIGILVVETKESIGPLPSTTVTGTYTYTGNASDLKNSVIPVPIPINGTVVKPNLPGQITILRTYSVPVAWTPEIPTNNVIMSESQLEVPAYSNMFMRLNFNDTPALSPHKDFISMLDIEFTPKVDATDFGLVVTPTDKPAAAPTPTDELKPLYLDVRWWGTFPGVEDPAVQDYYQNPPSFTFTVNDQWVADNDAERDSQGWPSLKLWLLNEGTNQWQQITSITKVSSGGGSYTFSATLPHFSNYAITANVSAGGPVAPTPTGPSIPVQLPTSYTVLLADSLGMQEGTKMTAVTIIEEFLQPKKVSIFLSDLVSVSTKPVALPTEIKVDKDVTVKISLEEVKQSNLTDPGAVIDVFTNPSALADIEVVITNTGDEDRQFEFIFTYNDAKGNLHRQSAVLDVEANSTISRFVELPFTEPGTYVITVEVRNLPGGDLAGFSTLTIVIPWLGLYLYTLLGVAGAILGISGIAIAIYMLQRPEIPIAAGAGGAGLLAAAYRKKTKIRLFARDEEEFKKDHRYQVLARLELRKVVSAGSQLKAVFALDVWSKKDGREFVVTYRAINALGVVVHESHILVPAMPDLQSLSIVMPFASSGHYTIQAEARPELEGDVLDKSELPVQINVQ